MDSKQMSFGLGMEDEQFLWSCTQCGSRIVVEIITSGLGAARLCQDCVDRAFNVESKKDVKNDSK